MLNVYVAINGLG